MNDEQQTYKEQGCDDEPPSGKIVEESSRERDGNHHEQPSKSLFKQWRDLEIDRRIESGVAILGLIIGIFVAFVALNTLSAMREQTDSMKGQLDEMIKGSADTKAIAESAKTQADNAKLQLDLSQRPWIEPVHEGSIRLILDNGRWTATLNSILRNHGESVALNVGGWTEMFPFHKDRQFGPAKTRQQQWCDANRHPQPGFVTGDILFPKATQPMPTIIGIGQNDISDEIIGLVIVGCVHYRASYDAPERPTRQTRFNYMLSTRNDGIHMGVPRSTNPTTFYLVRMPALWIAD